MEPIHADPLVQARSIVRGCIVGDGCSELPTPKRPPWSDELRASDKRPFSSGHQMSSPTAQPTKVQTVAFLAFSCIIIGAVVALRMLGTFY